MKIKNNILLILSESYKWRNRQLLQNENIPEPKLTFLNIVKSNLLLFTISSLGSFFLYKFINDHFAGYVISALSIFVGLFTSILIMIFDKFLAQKKSFEDLKYPNADENVNQLKLKNFSRQFVFVTLESLLIALSLIALLLIPLLLKENYLNDITDYEFSKFSNYNLLTLKCFLINSISLLSRLLIILLLYKFIKYLFFIFGALGAFLLGVFKNNVKI